MAEMATGLGVAAPALVAQRPKSTAKAYEGRRLDIELERVWMGLVESALYPMVSQ